LVISVLIAGLWLAFIMKVPSARSQTQPPAKAPSLTATVKAPAGPITVPLGVGTVFNAFLDDPIDTHKSKAGDSVSAVVAEDVTYEGTVVFPKGTKIVGHLVKVTSGGRNRAGSALFIQFDRAVLDNSEQVILNAGIQALAPALANPLGDTDHNKELEPKGDAAAQIPASAEKDGGSEQVDRVVSADYDLSKSSLRAPFAGAAKTQGDIDANGLFAPDSQGAFGRPDVKVYTPTSAGSHGTVLLSVKKHLRFESGTRLLLVVQPPASNDSDANPADTNLDIDE
jgi:hypothetical protein